MWTSNKPKPNLIAQFSLSMSFCMTAKCILLTSGVKARPVGRGRLWSDPIHLGKEKVVQCNKNFHLDNNEGSSTDKTHSVWFPNKMDNMKRTLLLKQKIVHWLSRKYQKQNKTDEISLLAVLTVAHSSRRTNEMRGIQRWTSTRRTQKTHPGNLSGTPAHLLQKGRLNLTNSDSHVTSVDS